MALLAVFGLQTQTTNRIGDSNDALTAASYFNKDVQSAQEIETLSTPACGTSSQTQLVGLEWAQDVNGNYDTVVSYVTAPGNGNGSGSGPSVDLLRQVCTAGASTTPSSSFVVSHDAGSSPTVTFTPSGFMVAGAPGASWQSTQGLYGVTLQMTEPGSSYTYSLSGVPSASTSTGQESSIMTAPNPAGCNLASPGSGTYANVLCFADFTSFTDPSSTCQQMKLSIANSPDFLQFCVIETPADTAAPEQIPTYYGASDGGYDSEAFLGNNGFYTGVSGLPALSQRPNTSLATATWPNGFAGSSYALTTVTFSNIQVVNAVGEPASDWTLVTGDAESTDTNGWLEFQNSTVQWNILPNSSTSLWGNSCYDSLDTATSIPANNGTTDLPNNGVLNWVGSAPPTAAQVGMSGSSGTGQPPGSQYVQALPSSAFSAGAGYATGSNGVLCQANISLNKTGSLMVAAPEPAGSTAPQNVTVTMQGESYQAIFLGVLL